MKPHDPYLNKKSAQSSLRRKGFTLVELMVVIGIGAMVTLAAWKLYRLINKIEMSARDDTEIQRDARRILFWLTTDIREAVWSDMLLGGKFIIQEIVNSDAGTELGGSRIKFAKFDGYDENGRIKIKKIMYAWNQKSGQVMRGNWEGPWTKDNNSEMVNPHEIGRLTHAKDGGGKGYLFFREITYDQDEKYGLVGRTVVLVGLKIVKSEKHIVELHTAIGPRYINSRDREPFWNENELSVMDYKEFEK